MYRPDKGVDLKGNVPLPTIEAFKENMDLGILPESSLTPISLFSKIKTLMFNQDLITTWEVTKQFSNDSIRFYRINDGGLYPSSDNEYIVASLTQEYQNKIAEIRFTPPSFEDTSLGDDFKGGRQVRYWSLSIGGLGMTSTPDSLCDDQIDLNPDGSATVLIAPRFLDGLLESLDYSVLNWGVCYKPILIYRQMLAKPDFMGNIKLVPMIDRPPSSNDQNMQYFRDHDAARFLGSFCPEVEMHSISSFLYEEMN